ncbi:tripartite tricarboxylate transporter substrate binding protein [Nonomuraea phyllanthi]|uniref:Tripartite tricarboxylate transporter substrate binding protein n=2 Tax=Nonomuraea phyllanthi TaxID=2219224 RepID=A0A5C4W771_9ACTN|nr:tripartite tricarboxylate transporter substrate binding protein [Nonomuraea phyllanthi]QFY14740.1 tripartite tricarboxylate transporter substrate binding protein [Nonomuraea phyllanthi]
MIVPFAAGGGSDLAGRSIAAALEKAQPGLKVTVENRDGGSGAVGYSALLGKKGNGNYLLATENAILSLPISGQVSFTRKDFTPVAKLAEDGGILVVKKDSPFKTCTDVVNAAKSGRVSVGMSGAYGVDNVIFTLIEQKTGVTFQRVPFESGGELVPAVLGGQVQVALLNPGEVIGQFRSGDLRGLCVTTDERYTYPELASLGTAKEQGIDVSYVQFRGILGAGGLDEREKAYWVQAAKGITRTAEFQKWLKDNYLQQSELYGDDFAAYLEQLDTALAPLLKKPS